MRTESTLTHRADEVTDEVSTREKTEKKNEMKEEERRRTGRDVGGRKWLIGFLQRFFCLDSFTFFTLSLHLPSVQTSEVH